jgi:hypothetical protein
MQIANRLFRPSEKDALRSKKIVAELSKMSADLPLIKAKEEELIEKYFDEVFEPLRKFRTVQLLSSFRSYDEKIKELEASQKLAVYTIQTPMKEFGAKESKLQTELKALADPIIEDAIALLERERKEVIASRKARYLDSRGVWVDKGGDVERAVKVRKVEHNLSVINTVFELISSCILNVRSARSIDEVIKNLNETEDKVNRYDLSKTIEEEVDQIGWERFKEMRLL